MSDVLFDTPSETPPEPIPPGALSVLAPAASLPRPGGRALIGVVLPAGALLLAAIGLWEAYVRVFEVRPAILPPPSTVARTLVERWDVIWPNTARTLWESVLGFLLAAGVGFTLALAIVSSRVLRVGLYPLLVASQAVPIIAIAPLLVIWFGFGMTSKVLVAALISFFPVVVSSAAGLGALDPGVVALMRSFPASRAQVFLRARLPNALPHVFAGLKVAAVFCVVGAVVGEWVGSDRGLGNLIIRSNATLDTDTVFAAIVVLSLAGITLFALVGLVERLAVPWKRT